MKGFHTQLARALAFALRRVITVVRCAACDTPLATRALLCAPCAATVVPAAPARLPAALGAAPHEVPLVAFGLYGGALADAIRSLKYRGRPDLGGDLGELLCPLAPPTDVVVPVPLHPRRLAERGYNQAALIARPVARAAGARLSPRVLARTRFIAPQASRDRAGRRAIAGAFRVRRPHLVRGQRVLLVDDVSTTGATLGACAAVVAAAGARSVAALVVARRELTPSAPSRARSASGTRH